MLEGERIFQEKHVFARNAKDQKEYLLHDGWFCAGNICFEGRLMRFRLRSGKGSLAQRLTLAWHGKALFFFRITRAIFGVLA